MLFNLLLLPCPAYMEGMRNSRPAPAYETKGIHIFTNSEGGITIGQTLSDDTEIHVSLSAAEATVLLNKLPALLIELADWSADGGENRC